MATKINPDFYGAENTFVNVESSPYVKRSASTIGALKTGGIYTGGSFDFTASPWGVGESSISSDFSQTISKSDTFDFHESINTRKNTPFWLYYNITSIDDGNDTSNILGSSVTASTWSRLIYKNRFDPDITINNNRAESSLTIDSGDTVDVPNSVLQYPVTMLDYQHVKLVIGDIWVKPVDSNNIQRVSFSDIVNNNVDVDKVIRVTTSTHDDARKLYLKPSIGGSDLDIPEIYKSCYYGDKDKYVRPWRYIDSVGYWYYDVNYLTTYFVYDISDNLQYTTSYETPTSDDILSPLRTFNYWGHLSPKMQIFNDVSYHWEYGLSTYSSNQFRINPIKNGDTYQSGVYRAYCYMDIDDLGTHATKNAAFASAILHEFAFMGLPIVTSVSDRGKTIGSDDVYLPIFDSHVITTGDYLSGAASLDLPNATWGDVFGANMPDYDPEYDPDAPPEPGEDFGDLSNEGHMQYRFDTRLNIWCFYNGGQYAGIDTVLNAINNLYLTDPDGNAKWQLDFKGSNPSDYIVGLYATPLIVPHSTGLSTFTIGPVDFDGDIKTYTYNGSGHFTFGSINLYGDYPLFGDFRDFTPYTQIELYIPLCGTVTLDPAFFVGHSVTVDMYYDILTMSCVAAIYRDGMTLYKTVNGSIGAQIPITSLDMGSYQNTIHSLESAQKQNDMRLMTSILTMGASAAAAIATGGVSLGVGAAALAGGAGLLQTAEQGQQIDYQLDHTAPTVAQTGTAEAQNSFCVGSMYAKLFVKRAKLLSGHNDTVYSKTVGNACCINDYIGNMSGLIVCSNINANDIVNAYGYSPTAEEINAIKQAFSKGVIV